MGLIDVVRPALAGLVALFGMAVLTSPAAAQEYPSKPIRIIVPYAAGGGIDLLAREVGRQLTASLKQAVVIENRPGANTMIGADACAKASPDGYTFCLLGNVIQLLPFLYKNVSLDPARELEPVVHLVDFTSVMVVNATLPVNSFQELVAYAKSKPGTLNFSSLGVATLDSMFLKWINREYGLDITHIPYQGQTPALVQSVLAGDVQITRFGLLNMIQHIRAGKVRPLLVNTGSRSPLLPNVPTVAELGLDFRDPGWYGLFAPVKTPRPLIAKIQTEVNRAFQLPAFREYLVNQGMIPMAGTSEEFAKFVSTNRQDLAAIAKAAGTVPE